MVKRLEGLIKKAVKPFEGYPVTLSGGIDSGVLAALMKPKYAINVELPGGDKYNESHLAKKVAKYLRIKLHVVKLNPARFKETCERAFKIIGKPVPHFNIFPLYEMFGTLKSLGEKDIVFADGPDESMCGYTRHLILNYLLKVYDLPAFENYKPLISKVLPGAPMTLYEKLIGYLPKNTEDSGTLYVDRPLIDSFCKFDMDKKRPEMDIMANELGKHFGIKVHRPYETKEVDEFMFNLPPELKINNVEYGKYALRLIAEKYLPKEIAWRKHKVGGPVYPVNKVMGWDKTGGEFSKVNWLKWQEEVLNG